MVCLVASFNCFMIQIGFKKEVTQRVGYYYNYKYYDFIMMSILKDEFRAQHSPYFGKSGDISAELPRRVA